MADRNATEVIQALLREADEKRANPEALKGLVGQAIAVVRQPMATGDAEQSLDLLLTMAGIVEPFERRQLEGEALRIAEALHGAGDPSTVPIRRLIAGSTAASGATLEALDELLRVVAIEEGGGLDTTFTLRQIIYLLWELDRFVDALPYAEKKLGLREAQGVAEADLIVDILDVGLCLKEAGRTVEALATFRRAHSVAVSRPDDPALRPARAAAVAEIEGWIQELEET
jgi:hypothetical protein